MSAGSARAAAVNQWVEFASQGVDYAPQLVVGDSGTLLGNNGGNQSQAFVPDATGTNAGAAHALPGVAGTPTITVGPPPTNPNKASRCWTPRRLGVSPRSTT